MSGMDWIERELFEASSKLIYHFAYRDHALQLAQQGVILTLDELSLDDQRSSS